MEIANAKAAPERVDMRVQRTLSAIDSTFKQMICELDAPEITVRELTRRADINYKTFYLHYDCLEDLYIAKVRAVCQGYFDALSACDQTTTPDRNRIFMEYFTNQEPYVERLICHPSYKNCSDEFVAICARYHHERRSCFTVFTQNEEGLFGSFVISNLFDIYKRWVALDEPVSVDILVEFTNKLLYRGMSAFEPAGSSGGHA